jgi:hypothetical protein
VQNISECCFDSGEVRWNPEYLFAQLMARSGMTLMPSTAVNCCDSGLLHITVGIGAGGRVGVCRSGFRGHIMHMLWHV